MLRKDALALEKKFEKEIAEILGVDESSVESSLTLSDKLKFVVDDVEYLFDKEEFFLHTIGLRNKSYLTMYELNETKDILEDYLNQYEEDAEKLVWSYENIRKLVD